ncbi:hypothetical protein IRJ41_001095 [Triplophysa rosa]|uniref:Uncharacterized protein n=1 Tax=Triplophysa rosa TaxID=992332 RepID=A0A9W7WPU1_TRIRA|nr:hypothetical protein IRJ41_001095 [Triplophysa rosa]
MSKTVSLVFVLVILTTILCNNSVCCRGFWKGRISCGCKIHPEKGLQCSKRHNFKTMDEIMKCICRNPRTYLTDSSKRLFQKMCKPNISTPL